MSLSCNTDIDGGDSEWYWYQPGELVPLTTKRSRKCCSCKTKINVGDASLKFPRYRPTSPRHNYIEESIYGDEVPLAPWFMCETCGGLYYSLTELGFCMDISDSLARQIKEYREEERAHKERSHAVGS